MAGHRQSRHFGCDGGILVKGDSEVIRYAVPPTEIAALNIPDLMPLYRSTITRGMSTTGRVHPSKFWRLATVGDVVVFVGAREPISRIRASVAMLWDFSSSQGHFRNALVDSISIIGSSLSRCGVDVWAGAYTTGTAHVNIFEVCGWRDRWDHRRAATLNQVRMDGTPTGAAMSYVRTRVLPAAPNHNKALVICTDGSPGDPSVVREEVRKYLGFATLIGVYVGEDRSSFQQVAAQYGRRYSFHAPTRESIPAVFNNILGRLHR